MYSELGRLRLLKEAKADEGGMTIAVAGCVAQAEGAEIMKRAPVVDPVVGPQTYHSPELIAKRIARAARRWTRNLRSRTSSTGWAMTARWMAIRPLSPCRRVATSSAPSVSCPTRVAPVVASG